MGNVLNDRSIFRRVNDFIKILIMWDILVYVIIIKKKKRRESKRFIEDGFRFFV